MIAAVIIIAIISMLVVLWCCFANLPQDSIEEQAEAIKEWKEKHR